MYNPIAQFRLNTPRKGKISYDPIHLMLPCYYFKKLQIVSGKKCWKKFVGVEKISLQSLQFLKPNVKCTKRNKKDKLLYE
jgi:hypothetical protein